MQNIETKLNLHRAFWNRESSGRPLIGICRPLKQSSPGYDLYGKRKIQSEDINEELYQAYKDCYTVCTPCADHPGDLFYTTIPHCGIPWYETLMGCPPYFSSGTLMAWGEHLAENVEDLMDNWRLPLQEDDPWLEKLRFILARRQRDFPETPIPTVLGRGIIDLLLAALPNEEVLTGLALEPQRYQPAMEQLTDLAVQAIVEQLKVIKPLHAGYANRRGLWAPGTACWSQEDGASLLGPELYRDLIFPFDRRIWDSVDYAMFHTHSVGLPVMIDAILQAPELECVECTVDAGGPSLDELIPLWKRVLDADKSLLVCLEDSSSQVDRVIAQLPAAGLAVSVSGDQPEDFDYLRQ